MNHVSHMNHVSLMSQMSKGGFNKALRLGGKYRTQVFSSSGILHYEPGLCLQVLA